MFQNYHEKSVMNNPYFRDPSQFPYAPAPSYEQVYPTFPSPPEYSQTQSYQQAYVPYPQEVGMTQEAQGQNPYGYPLPYPMGSYGVSHQQYPTQSSYSPTQQLYPQQMYQHQQTYPQQMSYAQQVPQSQMPQTQYSGPFTPYPTKQQQAKQPSTVGNFLSQFKGTDGNMDVNKMMNTAGTMVNAFGQLGGLAKQVGAFFIK